MAGIRLIRLAILEMFKIARGTTWTPEGAAQIDQMVEVAVSALYSLRESIEMSGGSVDWDAALEKLGAGQP